MEKQRVILRGALAALAVCRDREVLVEGRAGTSKTTGILHVLHLRARQFPGSRILVCRQTRTSMTESVLVSYELNVLGLHHPLVSGGPARENRHAYQYANGSTIVVGGLDHPERLYSTEWDTVYVAEATETTLDAWEKFARAMRAGSGLGFHQRIADCNPSYPRHWLNQRAEAAGDELRDVRTRADYVRLQGYNRGKETAGWKPAPQTRPMRRLISVHPDNPAYWDTAAWDWTQRGRDYVLGELATMTGHRRVRLFDGRWIAAEGTVYGAEFVQARHVVAPFAIPDDWPFVVLIDPGYDHPTCILWCAIAPNGCYYIVDEIYRGGRSVGQHAAEIHARNAGRTVRQYLGDPQHCFSQTAQSTESISAQYRKTGIRLSPWPRSAGQAEAMVNAVRERLHADRLKVFATCENTIGEFQSWSYQRTADGRLPAGDDAFEDANNHAMDCIRGLVAAGPRFDSSAGAKVFINSR